MKCTNCGKNIASCHYKYNVNGNVTEAHLCPECAAKLDGRSEIGRLGSFFDDFFSGFDSMLDPFFGRGSFSPLNALRSFAFPAIPVPVMVMGIPADPSVEKADAPEKDAPKDEVKADPELSRRRQINALREQMRAAADAEDYENAAKLRDELRKLEGAE